MTIVVFLGPSLDRAEATGLLDAHILPPAGQGDVYRAVRDVSPDAIGLIDGYFHQRASVWHREILYALSQGIPVFGGASMGALRAAELADFGMTGVGRIYEAYRADSFPPYAGPFDSDDEVAVIHGPAELGYPALSEALVDLRAAYAGAFEAGIISARSRDALVALAASVPFAERTRESVLAAAGREMSEVDVPALAGWLARHSASVKSEDARAVLRALADWRRAGGPPQEPGFTFEAPSAWRAFVAGEDRRFRHALSEAEEAVLDIARFEEPDWDELRRLALVRVSAGAPGSGGEAPGMEETRAAFAAWRRDRGLGRHALLQEWMTQNGVDEGALTQLFEAEARHRRAGADCSAIRRAVVDELRLSGRFAGLLARAGLKAERLARSPEAQRDPTPLEASLLLDGGEQGARGITPGCSAEAERVRLAFDSEPQLFRAAWRHRCAVAAPLN